MSSREERLRRCMEGARIEAERLENKASNIERRRCQSYSNKRLASFLRGKARVLRTLSKKGSDNPLTKSSGSYKGIRSVEDYLALIKKVRSIKTWNQLGAVLQAEMAKQPRVTQAFIPKEGCKGGLRPLGIPPHWVKAFEYWYLDILDRTRDELEKLMPEIEYQGFGSGESAVRQARELVRLAKGATLNYISLDQSGAFDSVNQDGREACYQLLPTYIRREVKALTERKRALAGGVERGITVNKETKQIVQWMEGDDMVFFKKPGKPSHLYADRGTPQGGVTSPQIFMLAQGICYNKAKDRLKEEGIRLLGVVYADDAVLGIQGGLDKVSRAIEILAEEFAVYGLQINLDKTEIVRNGEDIRLLGFRATEGKLKLDREHINSRIKSKWQTEVIDILEKVYNTAEGSPEERERYLELMDKINRKPSKYAPGIARVIGYLRYYMAGRDNHKEWLKELSDGIIGREGKTYNQFQEFRGRDMSYVARLLRINQEKGTELEGAQVIESEAWKQANADAPLLIVTKDNAPKLLTKLTREEVSHNEDLLELVEAECTKILSNSNNSVLPKAEKELEVIPLVLDEPGYNFISVSDWMNNFLTEDTVQLPKW